MVAAGNTSSSTRTPTARAAPPRRCAPSTRPSTASSASQPRHCLVAKPTLESFAAIAQAAQVRLLCITGGPGVVAAAMKSGKRAICAGPGNPPVVVDGTAPRQGRARHHRRRRLRQQPPLHRRETGVRLDKFFERLHRRLRKGRRGQAQQRELARLTAEAFTHVARTPAAARTRCSTASWSAPMPPCSPARRRDRVRPTPAALRRDRCRPPFVMEEQMMPMVPVVRARDFARASRWRKSPSTATSTPP
jgi:aldehyde dehydrogenase